MSAFVDAVISFSTATLSLDEDDMLSVPIMLITGGLDIEIVVEITGESGTASKSNHALSFAAILRYKYFQ